MRQGRPLSHVAGCRRRDLTSTFRGGRVQNERMRPSHTWREPGGSADSSDSDSVRLEPGRDKSAIEVATCLHIERSRDVTDPDSVCVIGQRRLSLPNMCLGSMSATLRMFLTQL